ncbi:OmpA family protein [Solirhodobacter olei]|uniref:OmpA family protein n=1 Tax=Solirhodobacter olei TaxID=2493082 RepID=UPI0030C88CD5
MKSAFLLAAAGALALSGCMSNNGAYNPNANAETGAMAGAVVGGLAGALSGGHSKLGNAALGAVAGGVVGAIAGGTLDHQARELRSSLGSNATVQNTGSELVVTLPEDILFATDSTAVRPGLQRELGKLAQNLNNNPDSKITIVGHTDNTGPAAHNQTLSFRRAQAVEGILMDDGVRPDRLLAYGKGESDPVATNLTAAGRAQNRRVEIHIHPLNQG